MSTPFTLSPIGYFHGAATYKYDAPRQGVFDGAAGRIELLGGQNFETALRGLNGFERIWVLFLFDHLRVSSIQIVIPGILPDLDPPIKLYTPALLPFCN